MEGGGVEGVRCMWRGMLYEFSTTYNCTFAKWVSRYWNKAHWAPSGWGDWEQLSHDPVKTTEKCHMILAIRSHDYLVTTGFVLLCGLFHE